MDGSSQDSQLWNHKSSTLGCLEVIKFLNKIFKTVMTFHLWENVNLSNDGSPNVSLPTTSV